MKKLYLLFPILLTACSTSEVVKTADNESYSVHSEYMFLAGGWERSSFEAREKAVNFCKANNQQIDVINEKREGIPGLTPLTTDLYFKCTKKDAVTPNLNNVPNKMTFDQAKSKCIELGFKVGTESFGQCILKLAN